MPLRQASGVNVWNRPEEWPTYVQCERIVPNPKLGSVDHDKGKEDTREEIPCPGKIPVRGQLENESSSMFVCPECGHPYMVTTMVSGADELEFAYEDEEETSDESSDNKPRFLGEHRNRKSTPAGSSSKDEGQAST